MRRQLGLLLLVVALVGSVAGFAVVQSPLGLSTAGPTSVSGTDASAVFRIARRIIRQVRYRDQGVLVYNFRLANRGVLPVTVTGFVPPRPEPRLFHLLAVTDSRRVTRFTVPAGGEVLVRLAMRMRGCETLSARAGSFTTDVDLRTTRMSVLHQDAPGLLSPRPAEARRRRPTCRRRPAARSR